ncbi:MAG: hypothetical protein Q4D80_05875 [Pseudomonadota bacterium]|nr:hypothetical protein [Pseudomonadota bacterium]
MGGFFGWFLVIVGVLAIFNAEKLPALRQILEEKFKGSIDVAKESSKTVKTKIEKVKNEIDNRKNMPRGAEEPEENTPEETEEALQFMSNYIKQENKPAAPSETPAATETPAEPAEEAEDKPVDLNRFE